MQRNAALKEAILSRVLNLTNDVLTSAYLQNDHISILIQCPSIAIERNTKTPTKNGHFALFSNAKYQSYGILN